VVATILDTAENQGIYLAPRITSASWLVAASFKILGKGLKYYAMTNEVEVKKEHILSIT
jgi:hypothetical protein